MNQSVRKPMQKRIANNNVYRYHRPRKGVKVCSQCHGVLFKKSWRWPNPKLLREARGEGKDVRSGCCPACAMEADGMYGGEVIVQGVTDELRKEFENMARAYGYRAKSRNHQHRIIEFQRIGDDYRIRTTQNQLAQTLAKKVAQVFNKVEVSISHSKEPYLVKRVLVAFV